MSDAPERMWAWINYDGNWDGTWLASSPSLQPERLPDAGYIRADIAEAKLAKAVEALQSIASNTCCDQCREAALVQCPRHTRGTGGQDR